MARLGSGAIESRQAVAFASGSRPYSSQERARDDEVRAREIHHAKGLLSLGILRVTLTKAQKAISRRIMGEPAEDA